MFTLATLIANAQWTTPEIVNIGLEGVTTTFNNGGIENGTLAKDGNFYVVSPDTTLEWHEELQNIYIFGSENIVPKFNKLFTVSKNKINGNSRAVYTYFDSNGWSTPQNLYPSFNGDPSKIYFVAGHPAFVIEGAPPGSQSKVFYKRALDPLGTQWPQDSIVLGSGWANVQFVLLDNYPTIFGRKNGGLWLKRSMDLLGNIWSAEMEVLSVYPNKYSIEIVNGNPAVITNAVQQSPLTYHLVYRRALDPLGNNWANMDTLLSNPPGGLLSSTIGMKIVDNKPIFAFRGDYGGDNIYIMESLDEYGNNWDTPYLIVDESGLTGVNLNINVVDNIPHVIYKKNTTATTYITYGNGGSSNVNNKSDWSGTVNSDWNNLSNWTDGILPSDTMNITIDGNIYTHSPVISNSTTVKRILLINQGNLIVNDTLNISQEIILDSESKIENNSVMKGLNTSSTISLNSLDTLLNNESLIDLHIVSLGTVINNDTISCDSLHYLSIYPGGQFINNGYTNINSKIDCFGEIINESKIITPKFNNIYGVLKLNQDSLIIKQE